MFRTAFILFVLGAAACATAPRNETAAPYSAHEVRIENRRAGVSLAGTLTLPAATAPAPAVLLLTVAGPNDRDQSFAGHRAFADIADALARAGVASLRLDDRGVGGSTGAYLDTDYDGLAADAAVAIAYLERRPRIDRRRIGVVGMSEGAAIGALAAARARVAYLVLLSAPGLPGVDALRLQFETTLALSGVAGAPAERWRALFDEFVAIVSGDPADPETRARLRAFLEGPGAALVPAYGFVPAGIEERTAFFLGPWYRSNLLFDPVKTYGSVAVPTLVVAGALDPVAPAGHHLAAIRNILDDAPTDDVTVELLEGHNHLLQQAQTGLPDEYARIGHAISPAAVDVLRGWIEDKVR